MALAIRGGEQRIYNLNRVVESRNSHIPILSDLRDSGRIGESDDSVMLLYREDYYDEECVRPGLAQVYVFNRFGPRGEAHLILNEELMRFSD